MCCLYNLYASWVRPDPRQVLSYMLQALLEPPFASSRLQISLTQFQPCPPTRRVLPCPRQGSSTSIATVLNSAYV